MFALDYIVQASRNTSYPVMIEMIMYNTYIQRVKMSVHGVGKWLLKCRLLQVISLVLLDIFFRGSGPLFAALD